MEEILLRFPHIGEKIFDLMDDISFASCRKVCQTWKSFIENQKSFWTRIIVAYERKVSKRPTENDELCELIRKMINKEKNESKDPTESDIKRLSESLKKLSLATLRNFSRKLLKENLQRWRNRRCTWCTCKPSFFSSYCIGHPQFLAPCAVPNLVEHTRGNTSLHIAAESGETEIFKIMLEYRNLSFLSNSCGHTPFFLAVRHGRLEIVEILLQKFKESKRINLKETYRAFRYVCKNGPTNIADFLIENQDAFFIYPNIESFYFACMSGNLDIAQIMFQKSEKLRNGLSKKKKIWKYSLSNCLPIWPYKNCGYDNAKCQCWNQPKHQKQIWPNRLAFSLQTWSLRNCSFDNAEICRA